MTTIILILALILFIWFILKPYIKPHDTIELWVGTNGSGKSLHGTKSALKMLRKNTWKIRFYNLLHPFKRKEKPKLFSNIPIKKGYRIISYVLKPEHLLSMERLPEKCVVFIDEVSLWLSQMDYRNKNIDICDDFATLYRHYTKGGYMVMTTQDINKCAFPYRYCTGSAFVLSDFKKHWWGLFKICSSSVRRISINGDIQAIEINQKEDNEERIYAHLFIRYYDTYAYSTRYDNVPQGKYTLHSDLKVKKILRCPQTKQITKIED